MFRSRLYAVLHFLELCCCLQLMLSVKGEELATEGHHREGKHHAQAHTKAPHTLTAAVSLRDCKRKQLPEYLQAGAADVAQPADYLLTTAVGYKPYEMRAFLTTFRRHNQAARVIVLVAPDQVRCLQGCVSSRRRLLKCSDYAR